MKIERKQVNKDIIIDGSVLKGIRGVGGWSKGIIALGITFLVIGILLGGFAMLATIRAGLFTIGVLGGPALLLIIAGKASQKKKVKNYLDYYEKESGYSREEIMKADQELSAENALVIGAIEREVSKKVPIIGCVISQNYIVMVRIMGEGQLRRIEDVALAAYSQKIPGINGYKWGLVYISVGDKEYQIDARMDKEACAEIIGTLAVKNPWLITTSSFAYEGKQYDVIEDGQAVVKLYKEKREQG